MLESGLHQSQLAPEENKFHKGNGDDGKHYWLTPWKAPEFIALEEEFGPFDFDPCPYPLPPGFDGLTCEWGQRNYVNPPFGSIPPPSGKGRKLGPTAWARKAIEESRKGKLVVLVYPIDKWVLMLLKEILGDHAEVRNLGDVKWLATEDGSAGDGTGRHIACFILRGRCTGNQRTCADPSCDAKACIVGANPQPWALPSPTPSDAIPGNER
jgi:hypothetical protein